MPVTNRIADYAEDMTAWRRHLHQHPELQFDCHETAAFVAERLRAFGVDELYEGIAESGLVAIINGQGAGPTIGLRADMDALPIQEETNLAYASQTPGVMHACGHDAHTTMLLGAAKHLARTRDFAGTAVVIFQPAEEGLGGARSMIADGLFDRFPCDEVYGMHNSPSGDPGKVGICKGAAMAGASFFDITVQGKGSHAAMPHQSRDPLVIASTLVSSLQTILSRNVSPLDTCVLSVTQLHAGSAYNVVPDTATLAGTVRYFKDEVCALAETRMRELCDGIAKAYDVEIRIDLRNVFDVLMNDASLSDAYLEAAQDIVGADNISGTDEPATGSEDFADMLKVVPGAYCMVGHTGDIALHNPAFVLGKEILPVGAAVMARMLEHRLSLG